MTAQGLRPFLVYPAALKLQYNGENMMFDLPQKAEDFVRSLAQTRKTYAEALQSNEITAATITTSNIRARGELSCTGGVYSKTNLQWGQASHSAFAPRVVQSSQSEYPVTGSISVDEVGSNLIIDRSQKSTSRVSNPRRYVKGGFSSSHETSRTQTGSIFAALALPEEERQTSSLTALQPQVSSSSNVQNIASQLVSGQSLQNQYSSSSHGGSGLQSAGGLSQIVSHQREGSSSGLLSSPGVPSPHTPESDVKLSSSPLMVSTQATTAQSSPILNMSSTLESFGPLLGVSVSASSSYGAPGASTEHVSSPSLIYHQPAGEKGSLSIHASGSESSLPLQSSRAAVNVYSSESLSSSPSIETQGSTFSSQGSPITAQVISSGPVIVTTPEVSSGSIGSPSQSISSQYSPGTLTPNILGSLSLWVSNQSTSDKSHYKFGAPSRSAMPLASSTHYVPLQTDIRSRDLSSPKPQGTYAVYAPSSPSKYLNVAASSPQSVSIKSGSNQDLRWTVAQVGTQAVESSQFMSSQGGSGSYSGALSHPQSSPSKYSSGAFKPTSPQTVSRQFTSVASSRGSSDVPFGKSSQLTSQGMSSGFSGSMQSLGTSSQNFPSSPTFSKFSSSSLVSSQSSGDLGFYGTVPSTSQIGSWPQSGVSSQFVPSQGASSSYSGSFPQSQSSFPKYSLGYPKPNSPETVSRPSASVKGSQGSSVDPLGAFSQLTSHGMSSSFSGSAQAQGTFSQPAPSSPTVSKFSSSRQIFSQSTSDQDLYGQLTATSQFGSQPQKGTLLQLSQAASGFTSGSLAQSQGSLVHYPPASHGLDSQGMSSSFSGSAPGTFSKPAHSSPTVSKLSSSRQVFSQSTSDKDLYGHLSATSQFGSRPQKGTSPQLSKAASGLNSGSLTKSKGSLGQYSPASPSKYVNGPMASQGFASQGMSSFSGSAKGTFSKPALSSPTVSKFSSSPQVFIQSTSDQDLYGQLTATSQFGSQPQKGTSTPLSQAASGFNSGSLMKSQGSLGQYPPASTTKYVNAPMESHVFFSEGMSSNFSGSAPGTYSKPAPSSPTVSKFSSPRQVFSQSTSGQDLYGHLSATSQFGSRPQKGTSPQLSQAASGFNSGSLMKSQGSLGQYPPASTTKYVNAPMESHVFFSEGMSSNFSGSTPGTFSKPAPSSPTVSKSSSPRQVFSQSTSDQDFYGQLTATSQFGSQPQKGTSLQLSQAASGFISGSLAQSQGSLVHYPPASHGLDSQGMSSSFSGSAPGTFSKPAHSSPTVSKFSSSRQVFSQSTSDKDLYGHLSATSQFGSRPQKGTSPQLSKAASGLNSGSLMKSQGSLGQYPPASTTKYVNAPMESHVFFSEGMSSNFSGSAPGTFSKPAPSSPTVSKSSSPRQVFSQSTSGQDLYGHLSATSQFGSQPQKGTSPQLSQAASGFTIGSLAQSQGSLVQYPPASHWFGLTGNEQQFQWMCSGYI
ncbi:hypothetical protein E1301_Tti000509 [Triplophysa tibetana]|uniref:Uncharacterized protein n=1 Tax=Triplophysa tibetana TaxID=1572043 RepID=A0A5A9N5M4_9TELE|nr:hypothetical protein E1301_Tti000509 [Triplophysa tibetana]